MPIPGIAISVSTRSMRGPKRSRAKRPSTKDNVVEITIRIDSKTGRIAARSGRDEAIEEEVIELQDDDAEWKSVPEQESVDVECQTEPVVITAVSGTTDVETSIKPEDNDAGRTKNNNGSATQDTQLNAKLDAIMQSLNQVASACSTQMSANMAVLDRLAGLGSTVNGIRQELQEHRYALSNMALLAGDHRAALSTTQQGIGRQNAAVDAVYQEIRGQGIVLRDLQQQLDNGHDLLMHLCVQIAALRARNAEVDGQRSQNRRARTQKDKTFLESIASKAIARKLVDAVLRAGDSAASTDASGPGGVSVHNAALSSPSNSVKEVISSDEEPRPYLTRITSTHSKKPDRSSGIPSLGADSGGAYSESAIAAPGEHPVAIPDWVLAEDRFNGNGGPKGSPSPLPIPDWVLAEDRFDGDGGLKGSPKPIIDNAIVRPNKPAKLVLRKQPLPAGKLIEAPVKRLDSPINAGKKSGKLVDRRRYTSVDDLHGRQGSGGEVKIVRLDGTEKLFVEKLMPLDGTTVSFHNPNWVNELEILKSLDVAGMNNIIKITDFNAQVWDNNEQPMNKVYFELCNGGDVAQMATYLLSSHEGSSELFCLHVFREVLLALAYLHTGMTRIDGEWQRAGDAWQQPIIHRDIKPANILLHFSDEDTAARAGLPAVKLADFGLAVRIDDSIGAGGTYTFQPPEVLYVWELQDWFRRLAKLSPRRLAEVQTEIDRREAECKMTEASDTFTLASSIFFMITGNSWEYHNKIEWFGTMAQAGNGLYEGYSEGFWDMMREMLQLTPAHRTSPEKYAGYIEHLDELISEMISKGEVDRIKAARPALLRG